MVNAVRWAAPQFFRLGDLRSGAWNGRETVRNGVTVPQRGVNAVPDVALRHTV